MTQFYARNETSYNGDIYSVPYDYIEDDDVHVYIDDEEWTDWEWLNESQIQLLSVPDDITTDSIVSVRRETDIDERVVTYTNNTLLNKDALNLSADQVFFAIQELYDEYDIFADECLERIDAYETKLQLEYDEFTESIIERCDNFEALINAEVEEFETTVNEAIEEFENTVNTEVEEFETGVTAEIEEFEDSINTEVEEFEATVNDKIDTQYEDFTNQLAEYTDNLATQFQTVLEAASVVTDLENDIDTVTNAVNQIAEQVEQVTALQEELNETFENLANTDLSNLTDTGVDFINQSKALETGSVSSNETVYEEVYGYAHSTFDSSKFTVTGDITITDDGIASGFTEDETLIKVTFDETVTLGADAEDTDTEDSEDTEDTDEETDTDTETTAYDTLRVKGRVVYSNNSDDTAYSMSFALLSTSSTLRLIVNNKQQKLYLYYGYTSDTTSGYSTYISDLTLEEGDEFDYDCYWDGSTVTLTVTVDGVQYTVSADYTGVNTEEITGAVIGSNQNKVYPWGGTIDLKYFVVEKNDVVLFTCNETGTDTYTIDGETIEIPYYLSKTGSKIADYSYIDSVQALYDKYGYAMYYTIDTVNRTFTLPMGEIYGMIETKQGELESSITELESSITELESSITELESSLTEDINNLSTTLEENYIPWTGNSLSSSHFITGPLICNNATNYQTTGQHPGSFTCIADALTSEDQNTPDDSALYYMSTLQTLNSENQWIGGFEVMISTDNLYKVQLGGRRYVNGSYSDDPRIGLIFEEDGTGYTYAPTPTSTDSSTKIATTSFVKSVLSSSGSGLLTYSKTSTGYYSFNSGLKVQWAHRTSSNGYGTTVTCTFPTSFSSSTSYAVVPISYNTTKTDEAMNIHITSKTSSSFTAYVYRIESKNSGTRYMHYIAVGY